MKTRSKPQDAKFQPFLRSLNEASKMKNDKSFNNQILICKQNKQKLKEKRLRLSVFVLFSWRRKRKNSSFKL